MELYGKDIVSQAQYFNPDNFISKEEFLILLSKTLDYAQYENAGSEELMSTKDEEPSNEDYKSSMENDKSLESEIVTQGAAPVSPAFVESISPWALEYIADVYNLGLVEEEDLLAPLESLSRKEAALIINCLFEIKEEFSSLDMETIFTDINSLSEEEIAAVKTVYTNSIMTGKTSSSFCPDSCLTRAEAAVIMDKISEKLMP